MADYLIQGSTLDAIAEAINHKAGTQVAMTPAEMVTAIGAISGGGGSALLASYAASEPVNAARIDFTSAMQGYDIYLFACEGVPSKTEYLCPAINTEPSNSTYGAPVDANALFSCVFVLWQFLKKDGGWNLNRGAASSEVVNPPFQYFKVAGYYADSLFSNFKISVYGVKLYNENS